ncbi:MAG: NYN domain-containing protein [Thermosynechococcaceae cyanobacterium MS004]|nr:NYN domain-containing protein [Thermosynechococcaceae cyanobacterium MS004]
MNSHHSSSQDSIFTPEQVLENRGRIAIFIDGSNLFYAALQLGIEIDYTKLLCRLTGGSRLLRSFFYTGVDPTNDKQQGFLLWMRRNGYRVITKELIQLPDGSKKANLDVEIAVDMIALVGCYDTAILVSGDGDLAYAVDAVSYRGIRVEVVSLRSMTSDSLINVADRYIDLDTIKEDIQKAPRPGYTYRPLTSAAVGDLDLTPVDSSALGAS